MKSKNLIVACIAVLVVGMLIVASQQFIGGKAEPKGPQAPPLTMEQRVELAASSLEASLTSLKQHDYESAIAQYRRDVQGALASHVSAQGSYVLPDGQTLKAWSDEAESRYHAAVRKEFDYAIDALSRARMTPRKVQRLIQEHPGLPELAKRYADVKEELGEVRAAQAANWLRVELDMDDEVRRYRDLIMPALHKKWLKASGYSLVEGQAVNYVEKTSTWKTLQVSVRHDYATFKVSQSIWNRQQEWQPPQIPHVVTIEFSMTGTEGVATSWDRLAKIELWEEPPELISRELADQLRERWLEKLLERAEQALAEVPTFELQ